MGRDEDYLVMCILGGFSIICICLIGIVLMVMVVIVFVVVMIIVGVGGLFFLLVVGI